MAGNLTGRCETSADVTTALARADLSKKSRSTFELEISGGGEKSENDKHDQYPVPIIAVRIRGE